MKKKNKIIDCITFFQENLQTELRINTLKNVVDKFLICESIYDHRGNYKGLNFDANKFKNIKTSISHVVLNEKFPPNNIPWKNQALQREHILKGITEESEDDYIMFSDPDEIPNPEKLKNLSLKKKYGIFMQKMFTYKLNLFNKYESPWEGTRICKKKYLKSVDWLRQKVVKKNLNYTFWRLDKEKSIEIIENGGWHFNYLLTAEQISKKLKSLAETMWDRDEYNDVQIIKEKINSRKDLFNRGHEFQKVEIDSSYPEYIIKNKEKLKEWII